MLYSNALLIVTGVLALIMLSAALSYASEGVRRPLDVAWSSDGNLGGNLASLGADSVLMAENTIPVDEIEVAGNTVITTAALQKALPDLGRRGELTAAEIEKLRTDIEEYYSSKGYILARVTVPATETIRKERKAVFTLIEGRIGEVFVVNKAALTELKPKDMADLRDRLASGTSSKLKHFKSDFIKKRCSATIAPEKVYNVNEVTRTVILLNELLSQDLEAQSFFIESKDKDGYYDALLVVKESKLFHVGLDYNNFGNPYTGENRYGIDLTSDHFTRNGDSLFLRGVYTAPSQSSTPFVQAKYSFPAGVKGTRVDVSFANADVRVGKELTVLDIRGRAEIYGLTVTRPLKRVRKSVGLQRPKEINSNMSYGFTSKSIKNYFLTSVPSSDDQIRSITLGYDTNWTSGEGKNFVFANVTQGLGTMFGGMKDNDPMASRYKASDSYTRLNVDAFRIQRISKNNRLFLILRGSGQLASAPVVVAEQFSIGGPDSVRGYMQSEVLGDSGYNVSAEMRISLGSKSTLQAALFADQATAYLNKPQPNEKPSTSLLGAGIGIRWMKKKTSLRLDWGLPLSPTTNFLNRGSMLYGQFMTRF